MADPVKVNIEQPILAMVDSVQYAGQIGRLDLVSALLAAVGILVAVFAFVGFFDIKRSAKDTAESVAEDVAEKAANLYI